MKKFIRMFLLCLTPFLFCITNSYSLEYGAYTNPDGANDHADAPDYADAEHSHPYWQKLGTAWDADATPITGPDSSDDGVSWSTDGVNYGHSDLYVGQQVQFKFVMYKDYWGQHKFDAIKAWLDWDGDKTFDSSDLILADQWDFTGESGYNGNGDVATGGVSKEFYTPFLSAPGVADEYWLRARVVCDSDIEGNMNNFGPTEYLPQGEVEDWKITVNPVPEPATMLLFGLGLTGLAGIARRKE